MIVVQISQASFKACLGRYPQGSANGGGVFRSVEALYKASGLPCLLLLDGQWSRTVLSKSEDTKQPQFSNKCLPPDGRVY